MKKIIPKDVDAFIAGVSPEAQPKLEELRKLIISTIPKVEERIWYGVPFYFYHGELVGLSVSKKHVSFGFGQNVLEDEDRQKLEEQGYVLGKGTMQIKFDQKLPTSAIKKILKTKSLSNKKGPL